MFQCLQVTPGIVRQLKLLSAQSLIPVAIHGSHGQLPGTWGLGSCGPRQKAGDFDGSRMGFDEDVMGIQWNRASGHDMS